MLYASQIRAARALLAWKQEDLARAADVGLATLGRIEQGDGIVQGNFSTILRLQSTLELQGIRFIRDEHGYGVRLNVKPEEEGPGLPGAPLRAPIKTKAKRRGAVSGRGARKLRGKG